MGIDLNLQEVMNLVSRQLEERAAVQDAAPVSGPDEMDAFMRFDELLADLNKQYLDARHMRKQAESEYGADDCMAELARDMEDSAWCAVQTRYMELRADRRMMAQAQFVMEEALAVEKAARKKEKEREALERFLDLEMIERMEKKKSSFHGGDLWLVMLFIICGERAIESFRFAHATHSFNSIAA